MEISYSQPTVESLFHVTFQYVVPPYQRAYAWESRQIDDLWNDISAVGTGTHFMGPLVLHNPGGEIREIIDGQQRITTLQLLLALIRDRYVELGDPPREPGADDTHSSDAPHSLIQQSGYAVRFRLRAGEKNRTVLEDFILRRLDDPKRRRITEKSDLDKLSKIQRARNQDLIEAYLALRAHLDAYLKEAPDPIVRLRELEDAVIRRVSLVVLDLKDLEDAFLLFETLNDRGLRLSAADLLKSHLLAKIDAKHKSDPSRIEDASDRWDEMVDQMGGGDISTFLRHYLLMRHDRVRKTDVFPLFKKDVAHLGPDKSLEEITNFGASYAQFRMPATAEPPLSDVLYDLNSTSIDTHRIALLPARQVLPLERFLRFARIAEVLSFRWVVTHGNAQELESLYQEAASMLHMSQGAQVDASEALLLDRLPSDASFRDAFSRQALGYTYVAAYALRKIELALAPGEKTIKPNAEVHVEHIMPRASTAFWRDRIDDGDDYHDRVRRWGNLTLLLKNLNQSVSNGDWQTKRYGNGVHPGYDASDVVLTRELLALSDWTWRHIDNRSAWLAEVAVRTWSADAVDSGVVSTAGLPTFAEAMRTTEGQYDRRTPLLS